MFLWIPLKNMGSKGGCEEVSLGIEDGSSLAEILSLFDQVIPRLGQTMKTIWYLCIFNILMAFSGNKKEAQVIRSCQRTIHQHFPKTKELIGTIKHEVASKYRKWRWPFRKAPFLISGQFLKSAG